MNKLRRSYEAKVLLIPLGHKAAQLSEEMASSGLDGIMTLIVDGPVTELRPLANHGWLPTSGERPLNDVVTECDMVVLLATDLSEVRENICLEVSDTAEANGVLTAALVVGSENWDTPQGNTAMVALRESVDMLVVVRSLRLATPFLDVLRGGTRQETVST
jgi:hypothetical protein